MGVNDFYEMDIKHQKRILTGELNYIKLFASTLLIFTNQFIIFTIDFIMNHGNYVCLKI